MKVILVIAALFAVCSSSIGLDWMRANNLLRELRNFEAYEEMQRRGSETRCSAEADVVFILDRSRSIYPPDFEKGKVFVQDVVKLFSPATSRFAVISFAEGATVEFSLSTHGNDQTATLNAIKGIGQRPELGGQTQTWAALELLYNQVLSSHNLRRGVQPTVLLITDGASQETERTADEARKAHSHGFKIIAIGIGNDAQMSELNAIASDPDKENVHMVANYSESLHAIRNTVATQVCPSNLEGCDNNKALDVMFSVSEHANAEQTKSTFDLMRTIMKKATIGEGKIQFGLAGRDCGTTWAQISLNEIDTVEAFDSEFSSRVHSFRNTLALRLSYLASGAFQQGDQASANNVAIVFIDKKSDIDNQVTLKASQMNGVRVIVMAGGDVMAADVKDISNNVIYFGSYDQLAVKAKDLSDKLCEALGRP